jgi:heme-degrading monooxygenase HmoA
MFIAVTTITAPSEALTRMAEAFRRSAPDLMQFAGFVGLELWRGEGTLRAVSRWESRDAMAAYAASDTFHSHHGQAAGAQPSTHGAATSHVEYYDGELII